MDKQREKYMKMSVEERKAVAHAVKEGEAYKKGQKDADRSRLKYIMTLVLFFVFFGLDNVLSGKKTWGDVASVLLVAYCGFAIVFLAVDSIRAKAHPRVWRCPNCGQILPCRSANFSRGAESYQPDVYVDHCPYCNHDLTK